MHQSVFNVKEDSFEDEMVRRSYLNGRVDLSVTSSVALAAQNHNRQLRRFQNKSDKIAFEHLKVMSPINRTEQQNRIVQSKSNFNSIGYLSATDGVQSALADSNSKFRHENGSYQFQRSNMSAAIINKSQEKTSEEDVSSSTPSIQGNSVRYRSVSFCTGVTPPNKTSVCSANHSVETSIPSCSILESILLNRNIPKFYTTRWTAKSETAAHMIDIYKRQRLHSMPLPTLVPTSNFRKAYSIPNPRQLHWASDRDADSERPLCLTFKKRKVSLDIDSTSENEVLSGRESERNSGESGHSESSEPLKISVSTGEEEPSRGSILHTLLTEKCSGIDEQSKRRQSESSEEFNCSLICREKAVGSDTCLVNPLPVGTISHVDSTESLDTLEMLALADKSRHCVNRQTRPQRVVIAKRMQPVVNRKVKKWLTEIAQLAAKYRDMTNLPHDDWVILLRNALSRLLLLFMAESNFQFAVASVSAEMLNAGERGVTTTSVPLETPTAQSVDDIQRFIAKCQAMKVDSKEYHCMRLITLFHSGCGHGLKRIALVEQVSSGACKILQDLVRLSRPDDKLRYGELLLHLHSLASVNSRMVQRLFCLTRDERDGPCTQTGDSEWMM